ncbi:hypothetical protein CBQ28_22255, partial [Pseudoalteromonas sp. GCY]|uniref:hypothetical protein n=1 Tax=Pseudoalteromonas sp. GCY TaxID=2003316 RepID=UPI000C0336A3
PLFLKWLNNKGRKQAVGGSLSTIYVLRPALFLKWLNNKGRKQGVGGSLSTTHVLHPPLFLKWLNKEINKPTKVGFFVPKYLM